MMGYSVKTILNTVKKVKDTADTVIDTASDVYDTWEYVTGGSATTTPTTTPTTTSGLGPLTAANSEDWIDLIQYKISTGATLTATEQSNRTALERAGWRFTNKGGLTLESYSYGSGNSGIQQAGLLTDVQDAVTGGLSNVTTGIGNLVNSLPWWKGAGGKLQLPWNDPRIAEYLKQFALDDSALQVYYRAPRGYVIVRDSNGRAFAVLKQVAKQFGLWRPSAKPPISATDWKHYKRNRQIEKRLLKIARPALRKHSRPATSKRGRK
jgi:hypothetical protein